MTATPEAALRPPMSSWEEELFAHFTAHVEQENTLLGAYEALASTSGSEFVRYLSAMLLEDERRHHRMFTQLANTMVAQSELGRVEDDIPPVAPTSEVAGLRPLTAQLIALEEHDKQELAALRRKLRDVRDTTLWDLLVQLAERDTDKHLLILRFLDGVSRDAVRQGHRP